MSDEEKAKRARRPKRPAKPITVEKGRIRAYQLWCKEHKPESARAMVIDPKLSIKPGEAMCEHPGCENRAFWEH